MNREMQRDDAISAHRGMGGQALVNDTKKSWQSLEKGVRIFDFFGAL